MWIGEENMSGMGRGELRGEEQGPRTGRVEQAWMSRSRRDGGRGVTSCRRGVGRVRGRMGRG